MKKVVCLFKCANLQNYCFESKKKLYLYWIAHLPSKTICYIFFLKLKRVKPRGTASMDRT